MENTNQKKTQRKRAFIAAIAMLLVSAIVLTTASFAWFRLGKTVQVTDMQLKVVSSGEGLVISANTNAWYTKLTEAEVRGDATDDTATADINEASLNAYSGNKNNLPEYISPASSKFAATGTTLPAFFKGDIDEETNILYAVEAPAEICSLTKAEGDKEAGYYAFDVFVKYEGDSPEINVNVGGSTVAVAQNAEDTTVEQKAAIEDAMRIGFVNLGVVTAAADAGSAAESWIVGKGASTTKPVTAAGEYNVAEGAYITGSSSDSYAASTGDSEAGTTADATMTLANGINKIRVYIWMEGQDEACTNELMSQWVDATISFKLV